MAHAGVLLSSASGSQPDEAGSEMLLLYKKSVMIGGTYQLLNKHVKTFLFIFTGFQKIAFLTVWLKESGSWAFSSGKQKNKG